MAAHVAIWGSPIGVQNRDLYAVAIDDGETTVVLGDTDLADDLRDKIGSLLVGTPEERLIDLLGPLTYFVVEGPLTFDGRTSDVTEPIRRLYFGS